MSVCSKEELSPEGRDIPTDQRGLVMRMWRHLAKEFEDIRDRLERIEETRGSWRREGRLEND